MIDILINDVKAQFKNDPKRLNHIECVVKTATELALRFDEDPLKAYMAAWYHDYYRNANYEDILSLITDDIIIEYQDFPVVFHGFAAATKLKEKYGIVDEDILNAISYHSFGRPNMSKLEKIILLADKISADRDYVAADKIRALAKSDLDLAFCECIKDMITYQSEIGHQIPQQLKALYQSLEEPKKWII